MQFLTSISTLTHLKNYDRKIINYVIENLKKRKNNIPREKNKIRNATQKCNFYTQKNFDSKSII